MSDSGHETSDYGILALEDDYGTVVDLIVTMAGRRASGKVVKPIYEAVKDRPDLKEAVREELKKLYPDLPDDYNFFEDMARTRKLEEQERLKEDSSSG